MNMGKYGFFMFKLVLESVNILKRVKLVRGEIIQNIPCNISIRKTFSEIKSF